MLHATPTSSTSSSTIQPSSIFHTIRTHAAIVTEHSKDVTINRTKVSSFASSLDINAVLQTDTSKRYEILKFDSIRDKLNFICTLDMLEIGSGYRTELHKATGRGASENILFGVIGLYIGGKQLNADFYVNTNIIEIADAFNLTKHLYDDIPIEGKEYITRSQPSVIHEFLSHTVVILNSVGKKLKELGCTDMYDFIINQCHHQHTSSNRRDEMECATADRLVTELYTTFPTAFDDSYTSDDIHIDEVKKILVLKKAQLLTYDLYQQFHNDLEQVNFSDINELTTFADNVIPCVLHAVGVLEYSDELNNTINNLQPVTKKQACELRCSSIIACHLLVQQLNDMQRQSSMKKQNEEKSDVKQETQALMITEAKLDTYLWMIYGKQKDIRVLPRHIEKSLYY